jgi:hypothetical protein
MNIRVEDVTENPDGSANATIHFDKEGLKFLIQYGVISILTEYAKQHPIPQPEDYTNATAKPKARKRNTTSRRS